jgi:hypothetical protein
MGPPSGKTIMAVVVWLVAWAIPHAALRTRPYETRRPLVVSLVLIALACWGPCRRCSSYLGNEANSVAQYGQAGRDRG